MYLDQPFMAQAASAVYKPEPTTTDIEEMMFNQMMSHSMSQMEERMAEIKENLEKTNEDNA
ncbi:MAG: hypothetical protein VX185_08055 [Pseudomonadota bacterium]|nr:hypothetical protein [Gammaproteobacteria bacterium]MEC8010700.1 hypothetical protein [Pseudomonadota bacterium]HBF07503.1 hypothetical protein [Gammaproteobacteria bacterium]|tara:strand:+ start:2720 stop:2902 length:183 start_codon:yes stop_codon:yes gene_type:complete